MRKRVLLCSLVASLAASPALWAQTANDARMCQPAEPELDKYGYLKALSLDLRGKPPTAEEYAALARVADVPEQLLDEWLVSSDFAGRVVRHHREILWNNISNVTLLNNRAGLNTLPGGIYYRRVQAPLYRGGDVGCLNEPATYDAEGEIAYQEIDGFRREGYVMVAPYWAPTTMIRVCAYDAQDELISPTGVSCGTNAGFGDRKCGCGPNLKWCNGGGASLAISRGLAAEVERRIQDLVTNDRPYTELFTSRTAYVNGPLSHFWHNQTLIPNNVSVTPAAVDIEAIPQIPFTEANRWESFQLGTEHAGILTSPAFLLRFQTNRARAARFHDAFLCAPLTAPPGGLPVGGVQTLDLQQREGCKYCHALLEPSGSHWGRWTERGAGFLDAIQFPPRRADCEACGRRGQQCTADCRLYYVTTPLAAEEDPYVGMLRAYEFRKPEHERNVEQGPRLFVLNAIVDARFPTCVAKRATERLLGREVQPDETAWVESLGRAFVASGYKYRELVKDIVTSPAYRRVR